jgi:hypothetical protein
MKKNRYITLLLIAFLVLLAAGTWWYYYVNAFVALPYNDALDYVSMARNISLGKGFTSRYLTPLSLVHAGTPYPNLWRAPLWPLFLAGCFRIFGATDTVAAGAGAIFYLAAIIPLFLLSREIAKSRTVAFFTCLLCIFSPQALFYSISGMTEPMSLFLMSLWVYLLLKAPGRGRGFFLFCGAVAGIFYLTRYNAIIFLPLSCLYLWWSSGEGKKEKTLQLALYLGGWLLLVSPWLWRNYLVAGNPFFSLQSYEPAMFTASYPAYTLYMVPQIISVKDFILQHPGEILLKIKQGIGTFLRGVTDPAFTGIAPFLAALSLPGIFLPTGERSKVKKLKLFIASCFFAQLAALLFVHYIPRLFFIFMPFYIIFALVLLKRGLEFLKNPSLKAILLAAVAAAALFTNMPVWHEVNTRLDWPRAYAEPIRDASLHVSPEGVIISNDGHILSWYADRLALKMPLRLEQVNELEELAPVEGIWLSNRFKWGNTPEADTEWMEIMRQKPQKIGDFYLFSAYGDGSLLYLKNPLNRKHMQETRIRK